ncbi:MAG: single-stranded-DNA-specific exonuclease RecJ [Fusobacteriaceae bacterium]|nr:single-stranded-DNA-specific exonuclease RecJ [Fusobacteriaceae bacterium]MBP6322266.1 single-stranded-DNA-specific exonuclease RecJ [Fusobacteriaceae bacterium]MBP9509572.1 single-stranded-DNA-specific exonuclease RecJ [Fusobacteriaceae bacterium]
MKWEYYTNPGFNSLSISSELQISNFLTTLLVNRGFNNIEKIKEFLYPELNNFRDPFDFENMEKVVEKIIEVKNRNGKIFIYGDYDVDGITAAVFLTHSLKNIGVLVDYYIPNRSEEDYGLDRKNLDYMYSCGAELVITVDTSINSIEDIRYGRSLGIDVIITDHHKSAKETEDDEILYINPKLSSKYGFKYLSGAGVALKVAQALYTKLNINLNSLHDYLDIVMIGTVADVVPVVDENRLIIREGLKKLKTTNIKGLTALIKYLKLHHRPLSATDISYFIAPLINSLGRIGISRVGADFFIKNDDIKIFNIIEDMKKSNKTRRELERKIYEEAVSIIEMDPSKFKSAIFLTSKNWHPGIIGIVASRLCMKYEVPTVLVSIDNNIGKASSRSLNGINIFNIFKNMSHLLSRFGGHDLAAGFVAKDSNLDEINNFFQKEVSNSNIVEVERSLKIDMDFSIDQISNSILEDLDLLSPFGFDNSQPIFVDRNLTFENIKKFGLDNKHFSGIVVKNNKKFHMVGFDLGKYIDDDNYPLQKFDIAYYPEKNFFKNENSIQIKIKDLRIKDDFLDFFHN